MVTNSSVNEKPIAHTPGPWRWMNATALVGDYGRRPVVLSWGRDGLVARGSDGLLHSLDIDSADARLIVASPELLAAARVALEEMRHTVAPRNSFTDAVDALDAAIAKAEGAR